VLADRYRIVSMLGSGGMGTVYEAERLDLGNMRVALKVLHAKLAERSDLVQRFRREAELIASIRHPNIVQVFDFVAPDDEPTLIVMELLKGSTLAALTPRERLSERRVAFIAHQVLDALGAAHAMNIVHRDLKPENIFLTTLSNISDVVRLLDFGIAKLLTEERDLKLTETGTVLGTPAYMAPEYARGEPTDARGDVYAMGCVMYEALTQRPPFGAANYNAMLFAIQAKQPEPIATHRPDVSPELAAVVARAMEKDPAARFPSAMAMQSALAPWVDGIRLRSVPPPLESAPTEELAAPSASKR
jgi:serine/threonine-protein kinase